MQARRRFVTSAGRRVLAALLVCTLGLAVAAPARAAALHKRAGHGSSVAVLTADTAQHSLRNADTHGTVPVAPQPAALRAGAASVGSALTADSYLAVTSPARGPPGPLA